MFARSQRISAVLCAAAVFLAGCTEPATDGVSSTARIVEAPKPLLGHANDTYRFDERGWFVIHGEVFNAGTGAAGNITVTATIIDGEGNLLSNVTNSTVPPALSPGSSGVFRLESGAGRAAAGYVLRFHTERDPGHVPRNFSILSSSFDNQARILTLEVNVTNDPVLPARSIVALAAIRDHAGRVIDLSEMTPAGTGEGDVPRRLLWASFELTVRDDYLSDRGEGATFVFVANG